jgi:hypothetical protein
MYTQHPQLPEAATPEEVQAYVQEHVGKVSQASSPFHAFFSSKNSRSTIEKLKNPKLKSGEYNSRTQMRESSAITSEIR